MIRAIIFDLDGVLIDSGEAHFLAWNDLANEVGQSLTRKSFMRTFGRQNRDAIPELFGITDPKRISALGERKESLYRERVRGRVPACVGAVELVRACHEAGVKLAVGSSGHPENIGLALEELGISKCFEAVVTGHDVSRGKPDPQVFLLAAKRLGVPPVECVVIEDAPAGVEAALTGGMKCVAVTGGHPLDALKHAHRVVKSLAELSPEVLFSIRS